MIPTLPFETTYFNQLASDVQIERTVQALELNHIRAIVAQNGTEARQKLIEMIPDGAEVFTSSSTTLETLGINTLINKSGRYNSLRARLDGMDRASQNRSIQRMCVAPDYMIGSVHAVTETGRTIVASITGNQLADSAGKSQVIWLVGTQKIVSTLEEGRKRLEEYTLPLEDARAFKAYGMHSIINKLRIVNKEYIPGRATMILVKENVGF